MATQYIAGDIVMLVNGKETILPELGIHEESLGVVRAPEVVNPEAYSAFVRRVGKGVAKTDFIYVEWCDSSEGAGFFAKYRFVRLGRKCSRSVAVLHTN